MSSKRQFIPDNLFNSARNLRQRLEGESSGPSLSNTTSQQSILDPAHGVWIQCKTALQGLDKCCSLFSPLKSAVHLLTECIEEMPDFYKRRQEYCDLALDLTTLVDSLAAHVTSSQSIARSECVSNIVKAVSQELIYIKQNQQKHRISRILGATQDEDDLLRSYRRIDAHFRQLQVNAVLSVWCILNEHTANARLDRLSPTKSARYDSAQADEIRRGACNPNTRTLVLTKLHGWSNATDVPPVYWLNGMAGTGKTTIAYSHCDQLERACQLGASFFCSRLLPECRDVTRIVPTIAYQLARFSLPYQAALCDLLQADPDVGSRSIRIQMEKLLKEPLTTVKDSIPPNVVIVIDALDECSDSSGVNSVLSILFRYASELPVKFFVTSRPEPAISDMILAQNNALHSVFVLHDIEESIVQADIETYLSSELAPISPSVDEIRQLARQAGRLFIYAATAVRYIFPGNKAVESQKRLAAMLDLTPASHSVKYREIDALYTAILSTVLEDQCLEVDERQIMQLVLHTVICAREPMTTQALGNLLGLETQGAASVALKPLGSVLHISSTTGHVSTLHASFPDYMLDTLRSGRFWCNESQHSQFLALRCFELMKQLLRFNICSLESSYYLDEQVPGLSDRVDRNISPELFYACRYWCDHMTRMEPCEMLCSSLNEFLSTGLLFWMEVLNLKKHIGDGDTILCQTYLWLKRQDHYVDMLALLQDARGFVTSFAANDISDSTPHIYISALPMWPKKSPMSRNYRKHTQGLMKVDPRILKKSGTALLATWTHQSIIDKISLSPDSTRVASVCRDGVICIWDAQTGRVVAMIPNESDKATGSVSYSSNGTRMAYGTITGGVHIWDVKTESTLRSLVGRLNKIDSLHFSKDDIQVIAISLSAAVVLVWNLHTEDVVSVALDLAIKDRIPTIICSDHRQAIVQFGEKECDIWDFQIGSVLADPFKVCDGHLTCASISQDGRQIAFGVGTGVYVWDTQKRHLRGPFIYDDDVFDYATAIAFSVDCKHIACGYRSEDFPGFLLCIWDIQAGEIVAGPFREKYRAFGSMVFSRDGTRLFSTLGHDTVCVWDTQNSTHSDFAGLERFIDLLAVSRDGRSIATGEDGYISVWDAETGSLAGLFESNGESAWFSPDGQRLITGSDTGAICIWDVQTDDQISCLGEGQQSRIECAALSQDGSRLISVDTGCFLRVWDVQTTQTVAGPFKLAPPADKYSRSPSTSASFLLGSNNIVAGSYCGVVHIWNSETGYEIAQLFQDYSSLSSSALFHSAGTHIVHRSADGTIRTWDGHTKTTTVIVALGLTEPIRLEACSENGDYIAFCLSDEIRVYDLRSGDGLATFTIPDRADVDVMSISQDATCLIAGTTSEGPRVWNMEFGDELWWRIDEKGWVKEDGDIIFWVPEKLRRGLITPQNPVIINNSKTFKLDFDGRLLGTKWTDCYKGPSRAVNIGDHHRSSAITP